MIYPICSVVAVFKMLVRILNTLPSRIWDISFFLFSDYLNPQLARVGILQKVMAFHGIYPFYSVVAVFKMLVRILNTLPSRIWDISFFLFSDYSKSTVGENGVLLSPSPNLFPLICRLGIHRILPACNI